MSEGRSGTGGGPRLRRLLPPEEAEAQLLAFMPLLAGHSLELLDEGGKLLAAVGEAEGPPGASWPLRFAGSELGRLQLRPAPASAPTQAAVAVLLTGLERTAKEAAARRELAGETLERYREVNLLYRLSEVLGGGMAMAELPEKVLDEALRAVPAKAALLVLDPTEEGGAVLIGRGFADGEEPLTLLQEARARLGEGERTTILGAEAEMPGASVLLWAPLRVGEQTLGGVLLCRPAAAAMFTAGEAKLLGSLASQAAAVIHNARLQQAALEQARMARELQLAFEVQSQLMPTSLPERPGLGWQVAADWIPALEVAGDFYDTTLEDDLLMVAVGDVADKGMAAALFMALTRSTLRASASPGRSAAEVVRRANRLLCLDASDGMFVTLAYALLTTDGHVRCVVAGHNPPLLLRADGRVERLTMTGILVGWDPDADYEERELLLDPGDVLLFYTDGVTEALNTQGQPYGEERMEAVARRHRVDGANGLLSALQADLAEFVGEAAAHDDATLLVVGRVTAGRDAAHDG